MDEATVQSPKRRKHTDFFPKLPSNSEPQEFTGFLWWYQSTDVPRHTARPAKRLVGRPKKGFFTDSQFSSPRAEDSQQSNREEDRENAKRGVYRCYSLSQKLGIVHYVRQHSEAAASRHYGVSRSTIYGWKDINKKPVKKFPTATKGKHLKKGASRPISYPQELDDGLIAWVLRQRDLQVAVRRQDIQMKASAAIAPDNPSFKASSGWVDKFMRHHSLSLR